MVPCSRSRTIAAPARMMASMVTLLMMPMTLVNQAVVTFGLNAIRTSRLTGRQRRAFGMREEVRDLGSDDLLRIAGSESGLDHGGRVDIDLEARLAAGKHVALEIRRNVDHERVLPGVHQLHDIALERSDCGGLKYGMRNACAIRRESSEWSSSTIRDRGIVQFLRIALRLR